MSTTEDQRMTVEEFIATLTGYDEQAIKAAFGAKPAELNDVDKSALLRSLYFTAKRREGLSDADAKKAAQAATLGEVNGSFSDDDEPMPDDPITESGKDEPELSPTPSSSQASVSGPASSPPSTQP